MEKQKCKLCGKELNKQNKSGYCTGKCYFSSPQWKEYQARKQKEWYRNGGYKKKKEYRQQPEVKARLKEYMKQWWQKPENKLKKKGYDKKYYEKNKSKIQNYMRRGNQQRKKLKGGKDRK